MKVTIKVEGVRQLAEEFRAIGNTNLPITMAATLSRLASKGQAEIRNTTLPQHFILRRAAWARSGIRITPATKANWEASVQDINPYMALQETGGEKIPFGRFIAVPLLGARPSPTSLIAAQNRPAAVMAAGGFIRNGIMYAAQKTRGTGMRRPRIGQAVALGADRGSGGFRIVPMYALVSSALEKPRYEFVDTIRRIVDANYREEFGKAWEQFNR